MYGNSGGAVTGLDLVTRYPDQVGTLIAHEPPLTELLPDAAQLRAQHHEVYDTYRHHGPAAGMQKFLEFAGLDADRGPAEDEPHDAADPEMQQALARMQDNADLFLGHMYRQITRYRPDPAALRDAPTRVVVAGGTTSSGQLAHRTAVALGNLLGTAIVDLPGDHAGFVGQPDTFAQVLYRVLTETT